MSSQSSESAATGRGFAAVVLAGDRKTADPVASARGVPAKVLAPVAGVPMILRVLDALAASDAVEEVIVCGPARAALEGSPALRDRIHGCTRWTAPGPSPSASAQAGLEHIEPGAPVLLTTGDHALLSPEIVAYFIGRCLQQDADAMVGLVEHAAVLQAFPGTKRTVTRFREGGYCGCNLYAFLTPAGRRLVPFWRQVEATRKRPWQLVRGLLGVRGLVQYLAGRLTLQSALAMVSRRLQVRIGAVLLPFPEAGVDVDTLRDLELAEARLAEGRPPAA